MTAAVSRQGLEFLLAAALGVGLGLLYDVGRALRRERLRRTVPVDMLFALILFLSLWLTSIYAGGLRLFHCLGVALGAGAYFLTFSPYFVSACRRFLRLLGHLRRIILAPVKKSINFLRKLVKKLFPSSQNWVTIGSVSTRRKHRREVRR